MNIGVSYSIGGKQYVVTGCRLHTEDGRDKCAGPLQTRESVHGGIQIACKKGWKSIHKLDKYWGEPI